MMANEDKLIDAFIRIHDINNCLNVEIIRDEYEQEILGVGFYKNGDLCWSSTLAEIACDLALEDS
jgi:hypothetical protein